jgi:BirA family biotin operon repressor/biotin-[acetyl-CoA-carboxylase] ligase
VLRALIEHRAGVSGESLASDLGISRVAIRKHIAALRDQGYGVEARPGEGYRLLSRPDAPLPLEVMARIKEPFYVHAEGGHVTDSTNDDARRLAVAGEPEGTVVLAGEQRAGRGRLGRVWESPEGGAYASIVLRPDVETPEGIVLPLVVGIGVAEGLESLGVEALVKWPNDILAPDGRKIAGILCEGLSEGWQVVWVVAGIGINVSVPNSPEGSVSVDELAGRHLLVPDVTATVLDSVARAYLRWKHEGFGVLAEAYERRSWLAGREVTISDAAGRVLVAGRVAGIDGQGRLLVDSGDGIVPVAAGDVTLRRDGAAQG